MVTGYGRRERLHVPWPLVLLALLASATGQSAPAPNASASAASTPARPSIAEIRALLRSEKAADVSWGAWHSSAGRLKNILPDLEAALARCERHGELDVPWALAARCVLAALIQTDAKVAPPVLARWGQRSGHLPA